MIELNPFIWKGMVITPHVMATAGDNVVAEIKYTNENGEIIGYWAYGLYQLNLPYQGADK